MFRLFLLRRALAISKAAITISDSLKPATWKRIAVAHLLVGVSFLLVYGVLDTQKAEPTPEIPPVYVARIEPVPLPTTPRIDNLSTTSSPAVGELVAINLKGTAFVSGEHFAWIESANVASNSSELEIYLAASQSLGMSYDTSAVSYERRTNFEPSWASNGLGWKLPDIAARGPQIVWTMPSADKWTALETLLKFLLLLQGVTGIINSSLATIFALIACNRGKVDVRVKELDVKLKALQIQQIQEQLDKDARERQREIEAAARSSIILLS